MKEISLRQAQLMELDILMEFARFCDETGLRYWLAYGTLLGAVRHGGFIPWDDDVDVLMPRADYEKMISLFSKKTQVPYYQVVAPMDVCSRHSFVKIMDTRTIKEESNFDYAPGDLGIDIDIFPLDGQPDDEKEYQIWYDTLMKYYHRADFVVRKLHECRWKNGVQRLINILGGKRHLLGVLIKRYYLKKAEKLHKQYPYETAEKIGMTEHCFLAGCQRFPKEIYDETTQIEFEGIMFRAPKEYETVLYNAYGDYMRLPPKEEQQGHLIDKVYWKESRRES